MEGSKEVVAKEDVARAEEVVEEVAKEDVARADEVVERARTLFPIKEVYKDGKIKVTKVWKDGILLHTTTEECIHYTQAFTEPMTAAMEAETRPTTDSYEKAPPVKSKSKHSRDGLIIIYNYGPTDHTSAQRSLAMLCAREDRQVNLRAWDKLRTSRTMDPGTFEGFELIKRGMVLSVNSGVDYTKPCTFEDLQKLAVGLTIQRGRACRICVFQNGDQVFQTEEKKGEGEPLWFNLQLSDDSSHYQAISKFPRQVSKGAGSQSVLTVRDLGPEDNTSAQRSLVLLAARLDKDNGQDAARLWERIRKKRVSNDAKELNRLAAELSRISEVDHNAPGVDLVRLAKGLSLQRGHACHIRVFSDQGTQFQTEDNPEPQAEWFNLSLSNGHYQAITKPNRVLGDKRKFCNICGTAYQTSHPTCK